jgi:diguanylate cyclase (GGDEF)-like protein
MGMSASGGSELLGGGDSEHQGARVAPLTEQDERAGDFAKPAASLLEHEAHVAGLRGFSTPTLEAVDRRRSQLWTVAFAALVSLSVAVALLTSVGAHRLGFANRAGFRIGTVLLVSGLALYVIDKERHLRRLSRLLVQERVLAAGLSNRLKELALLYEAGKAMNSVLVIDEVLKLILSSAFELLNASSGSIMLFEGSGPLREVCRAGTEQVAFGLTEGMAKRVVADGEPLVAQGRVIERGTVVNQSTVCVPLVHRGEMLGALSLSGSPDHTYTEHDLRAVSLFAEHAAVAVANARLYEAERSLSAQLSQQGLPDPLTEAANRVLVVETLADLLSRVRRNGSFAALIYIDVDDFKLVNDELGPAVGDLILSMTAQRIAACVRPTDTVGRVGSDEFVVVCEQASVEHDLADRIAIRLLSELSEPLPTPFGDRRLTASIGIALCGPDEHMSAQDLLLAGERAMYRAKMTGKAKAVTVSGVRMLPTHSRDVGDT